ncbi:PPOX class F420-dependent oxidoreductase [Actinomycetota bacterium]|nr:PPOX class F420-dependent oxidoreductase [Actinomycetota bacterium]
MVAIPEEVLPWFDAPEFAVIATIVPSGPPHQAVVWVTRDGNDVLVSTFKGRRKHLNVEADPQCSVIVYPKDNPYSYDEVRGTAEVEDEGARELIDRLCQVYTDNDRYTADDDTDNVRLILRIHPEKVVTLIR